MFNLFVESQPDGDLLQLYTSIMAWNGRTRLINGTKNDPTAAERPAYSVLDCETMRNEFNVKEVDWRQELNEVITLIARRVGKL